MPAGAGTIGRIVAIVAAAAMPLVLLTTWYRVGVEITGPVGGLIPIHPPSQDFTGWETFSSTDSAIAALGVAIAAHARAQLSHRLAHCWSAWRRPSHWRLLVVVCLQAFSPPNLFEQQLNDALPFDVPSISLPDTGLIDASIHTTVQPGAYIGVAAAALALLGSGVALFAGTGPHDPPLPGLSQARLGERAGVPLLRAPRRRRLSPAAAHGGVAALLAADRGGRHLMGGGAAVVVVREPFQPSSNVELPSLSSKGALVATSRSRPRPASSTPPPVTCVPPGQLAVFCRSVAFRTCLDQDTYLYEPESAQIAVV